MPLADWLARAPTRGAACDALLAAADDVFSALEHVGEELGAEARRLITAGYVEADSVLHRRRLTAAVAGGDARARAALLNELLGEPLIAPEREEPAGARVTFRRGAIDLHLTLRDGSTQDFAELFPDQSAEISGAMAAAERGLEEARELLGVARAEYDRTSDQRERIEESRRKANRAAADARATEARARVAADLAAARLRAERLALDERARAVPAWVREPPPWWALVSWLRRLFFSGRWRRLLVELDEASRRLTAGDAAVETIAESARGAAVAVVAREAEARALADEGVDAARARLARAEEEAAERLRERDRCRAALANHLDQRRSFFRQYVQALTDASQRANHVEELEVSVPGCPDEVDVVDLATHGHLFELQHGWQVCRNRVDCLLAAGDLSRDALLLFVHAPRLAAGALAGPAELVAHGRVLLIGRLALDAIQTAETSLGEARFEAAARESTRRSELDALELIDPASFAGPELGHASEHAALALEPSRSHLEAELERLRQTWTAKVSAAPGQEELRAAIARIDVEAVEALAALRREVAALFAASLLGAVHDLAPRVTAEVRRRRVELEGGAPPDVMPRISPDALVPPMPEWPSFSLTHAVSRLGAFFRTVGAQREQYTQALDERVDALRRSADAKLLALEPAAAARLRAALEQILDDRIEDLRRRLEAARAGAGTVDGRGGLLPTLTSYRTTLAERIVALAEEMDALAATAPSHPDVVPERETPVVDAHAAVYSPSGSTSWNRR